MVDECVSVFVYAVATFNFVVVRQTIWSHDDVASENYHISADIQRALFGKHISRRRRAKSRPLDSSCAPHLSHSHIRVLYHSLPCSFTCPTTYAYANKHSNSTLCLVARIACAIIATHRRAMWVCVCVCMREFICAKYTSSHSLSSSPTRYDRKGIV